jgi:prepilin-type N-terminal cleavage/methylation domain-containing protein
MTRSRFWRPNPEAGPPARERGFTLTELAITVVIIALLIGGLALTLSAQNEARQFAETRARLDAAQEALIGFAIRNGRLPCPATAASNGIESPVGGGDCGANARNGYLPAATLGMPGTIRNGYLLDAWDNEIRYAVTTWQQPAGTYVFTTSNQIATVGVTALVPNLRICSASTCNSGEVLTGSGTVAAVVYSLGKNGRTAVGGAGADEIQNQNNDNDFVSHDPRPAGGGGGEFDDIVTWLSVNVLVSRMVAAGAL